ncbi:MAG: hemerythrin domain-containing protein [Myxococcales bacterium]|nr:hemerythrin domain-containing protein [Myxococcales bacterium]MCB9531933.1 hemerythrin domain-containing protein [Myxococcales bacterium]MCB9533901.1 hemerythrin domain-containing protein [Myxococcales bacterium]
MQSDELERLEHDHAHLNRLVDGLRESAQACLRGETEPLDLRADLEEFTRVAHEELFEHFDREETGLFPYLSTTLPDLAPTLAQLEAGHDRMCGLLVRLERAFDVPDERFVADFDAVVALFARFDALYVQHAKSEGALLRALPTRLDAAQRREVARLLSEL